MYDQICYVQCGVCSTILLVNVPCSRSRSMPMVVAVECGHCSAIIKPPAFLSLHLFSFLNHQQTPHNLMADQPKCEVCPSPSLSSDDDDDEEEDDSIDLLNQIIHKPPEKKQRPPSAYNHFIKEEIKRLKSEYPNLSHKQAFSAAAKNWAHYPQNRGGEVNGCAL